MRRQRIAWAVACIGILIFGASLWAQEEYASVVSSRFEQGLTNRWEVHEGIWTVEAGALVGEDGSILSASSFPTDRRIEARVLLSSAEEKAVIVGKYAAADQWIRVSLTPDGEITVILMLHGEETVWTTKIAPLFQGWHGVVIGFKASRSVIFVAGEKVIEVDSSDIADMGGKVGLAAQGRIQFDDVSVTSFVQPALITSIGQSQGVLITKVLAGKAGLEFHYDESISPDYLEGNGTLMISIGASSKGLGAAGIDVEDEIVRGHALISRARELGIPVVVLHIEGAARRGTMTDRLIREFLPLADYVVIKADGDEDGLFTEITLTNNIPLRIVEATLKVAEVLKDIFSLWD